MTKKALISISNKDGIVEFALDNTGVSTIAIDDSYDIFD